MNYSSQPPFANNPLLHPADAHDIEELREKIAAFQRGDIDDERFRHFRLTRGVYGQRQQGVQMFRIKIPYGRLTADQLVRIADVAEAFTNGNLHLTTRQDVQYHHVRLDDAPTIWQRLAEKNITAREACGNTVRNITTSPKAGIDPEEPFDVSPYSQALFEYLLRNPICQEMGRKVKIAFSSSERDTAFAYFHDFGMIPRLRPMPDGTVQRGFRVLVGGGLGAQAIEAEEAFSFLPDDQLIPFVEAALRVFDRFGEREKRQKARMKFLLKNMGLPAWLEAVRDEMNGLLHQRVAVAAHAPTVERVATCPDLTPTDPAAYALWRRTNVFQQKQKGWYGVFVKVRLGNLHAADARALAQVMRQYAAHDDLRITANQGFLLRYVGQTELTAVFNALHSIGLATAGFDSVADITACPGTDTCNLAVANSTDFANALENIIWNEYPQLIDEPHLTIKISGCMNACGQHTAASIGFHGSSLNLQKRVVPAMQVLLGGGLDPDGTGRIGDKVIKLPTKRVPNALRILFDDFLNSRQPHELFNAYYRRQGKIYFYDLLKPLAGLQTVTNEDFVDWGQNDAYLRAIGVGECAGVSYDAVAAILHDARAKLHHAHQSLDNRRFNDATYHAYAAFVVAAKALLLSADVKCNTQIAILNDFDQRFWQNNPSLQAIAPDFTTYVLRFKNDAPTDAFARQYVQDAADFVAHANAQRNAQLAADKLVVHEYYKA